MPVLLPMQSPKYRMQKKCVEYAATHANKKYLMQTTFGHGLSN